MELYPTYYCKITSPLTTQDLEWSSSRGQVTASAYIQGICHWIHKDTTYSIHDVATDTPLLTITQREITPNKSMLYLSSITSNGTRAAEYNHCLSPYTTNILLMAIHDNNLFLVERILPYYTTQYDKILSYCLSAPQFSIEIFRYILAHADEIETVSLPKVIHIATQKYNVFALETLYDAGYIDTASYRGPSPYQVLMLEDLLHGYDDRCHNFWTTITPALTALTHIHIPDEIEI